MYDGINWETIPVSNNTVIRSLAVDSSGKVYVGAKGDFGYLKYDNAGKTIFSSLLHTIESKDRDFLDIWNIHVVENEIYFQTESKIFKLKNNLVTVINIDNLARRSYSAGNNILMQITGKGLAQLNKDSAILIPGSEIFINKKVLSIVLYANNKLLIGTSNELFVCSFKISNDILVFDHKPKKLKTEAEKILQVNQLYHILKLNDNKYCIGTKGKGAIIIDSIGTILQNINTKNGLLADEVYYSYLDLHNNLWLGLGFGISNINIESPVTYMDETSGIKGTVLSIIKFKGVLYIGTTTGVFYLTNDGFIKISGIYNQVWDFIIIPDQNDTIIKNLYASTSDGLFLIKNNQAINIFDKLAFSFQKSNLFSNRLYIANNSNLIIGRFNQALNIKTVKEINVNAEIRNIVEDELGNLWLATNSSGIIFIKSEFFNNEEHSNSNKYITTYDTSLGLPTLNWNIPHLNKNKIVVATKKGIYTFNKEKNIFEPHIANKAFKNGTRWIYTMQINNGNIWFDSDKGRGILIKQYDGNYILSESAFQPVKSLLGDYGNKNSIYFDGFVTWFGLHKGILRFDKKVSTKYNQEFSVLLKNVFVKSDSVLFSCFLADKNLSNYTNSVPLSHQCNNPTFNYSAPFYISEENITFSYYLEGFDKQWSEWSLKSEKEYTNLPAGEYIFNIKAKNIFEKESEIFKYSFEISAPWYNHILAYFVYFILAFLIILIIVKLNIRRLKLEKINLEKIITERTKKISKQKLQIKILSFNGKKKK
jgi:ligand-binding sensor domain-containing protein